MQRKQSKFQSILKQSKFKASFQIGVYLHQLLSVSMLKQGNYFLLMTLNSKANGLKQQLATSFENISLKAYSTRTFNIRFNNHIEMLHELGLFSFNFQQTIVHKIGNHKFTLCFQLFRFTNEHSQELQRKSIEDFQCVSMNSFEIKINENLSFIQYFDLRFQLPYSAQVSGVVTCLLNNFQLEKEDDVKRLEDQLIEQKKMGKLKIYPEHLNFFRKLVKQHRYTSYCIQKALQQTFFGFKTTITIPSASKRTIKQTQSLTQQQDLQMKQKQEFLCQNRTSSDSQRKQIEMVEVPRLTKKVFSGKEQKKCSEEQFMNYLASVDNSQKSIESYLCQLKNLCLRNIQVFREINTIINQTKQDMGLLTHKINLFFVTKQFNEKKSMIYGQKTIQFGASLPTAAQEMKCYEKILTGLKSKEKQNFFTKMSQIFNLIPNYQCDLPSVKFDQCPYVFYSFEQMTNGVKNSQIEDDDDDFDTQPIQVRVVQQNVKKIQYRNVFILAHGYQASSSNMEKIKICLKKIFPRSKIFILKSYSSHMDRKLQQMGEKAAKQIEAFIQHIEQSSSKKIRLILVGHSMGGIILRSSFQYLSKKTRSLFHTYISFASPHLGYIHCKNLLTQTGIKLIQSMHPSQSLKQLSNKDSKNIKQTFIYKLANEGSLRQFQNILLFSSIQDKYVPWNSARLQLYKQSEGIGGKNTTGGWLMCNQKHYLRFVEEEMIKQILGVGQHQKSKVRNVHRFDIDFNIHHINLDTMIGRTSHVAFLGNQHIFSIVFENLLAKTLYSDLKAS